MWWMHGETLLFLGLGSLALGYLVWAARTTGSFWPQVVPESSGARTSAAEETPSGAVVPPSQPYMEHDQSINESMLPAYDMDPEHDMRSSGVVVPKIPPPSAVIPTPPAPMRSAAAPDRDPAAGGEGPPVSEPATVSQTLPRPWLGAWFVLTSAGLGVLVHLICGLLLNGSGSVLAAHPLLVSLPLALLGGALATWGVAVQLLRTAVAHAEVLGSPMRLLGVSGHALGRIDKQGGRAALHTHEGQVRQVPCRTYPDRLALTRGQRLVTVDYDDAEKVFVVVASDE